MGTVPDHMKLIDVVGSSSLRSSAAICPSTPLSLPPGTCRMATSGRGSSSTSPEDCHRRWSLILRLTCSAPQAHRAVPGQTCEELEGCDGSGQVRP